MRRRFRYMLLVLVVLIIGGGLIARRVLHGPSIRSGSYLLLDVQGRYAEAPPEGVLGALLHHRERTFLEVLTTIRKAQVDQRIKGVLVRISALEIGWAKVEDIRDALLEYKKSDKPLVALLEQEVSGSNKEYYLATVADRIYLAPSVTAPLSGLAAQFFFLGGVWEKLDIQMDVEKIREYKTLGDMIANKEMTPAHREMANSLLDSIDAQFVAGLAQGRRLSAAAIADLIARCPVSPEEFEAAHLSDGTKYVQDLRDEIGGEETPLVPMKDYVQVDETSLGLGVGPKIAVVYGVGDITSGESGSTLQGDVLGADTVSDALKDAADDDAVRAILFRVDSPGGSALASDLVWRATRAARKKKPLIVSMSDVAASGGYYIGAGATRIVAQPGTMTGSIGVLVVRPMVRDFLGRLGISTETIARGPFAAMFDLTTPLSPEARQKIIAEMDHIYDVFTDRVAAGRKLSTAQVNEIGRGRVWTGAQAKDNGLVDELGGFQAALQATKAAVEIPATQEVELVFYPHPKGLLERVTELIGTRATVRLPLAWQNALTVVAPPFEAGTFLAMLPERIEIR